MAYDYEEVVSLDCSTIISLGGVDKATKKPNPKQIEGFYLGTVTRPSKLSTTGVCDVFVFKTQTGNVGVWGGRKQLTEKMSTARLGYMTLLIQDGMIETDRHPMYAYKLLQDKRVKMDVSNLVAPKDASDTNKYIAEDAAETNYAATNFTNTDNDDYEETALDEEEAPLDEVPLKRPTKANGKAPEVTGATQKRVQDLLNRGKRAV